MTDSVTDHVYTEPSDIICEESNISKDQIIDNLKKEISSLKLLNEQLKLRNQELSQQLNSEEIPIISQVKLNDMNCNDYTGFKTQQRLKKRRLKGKHNSSGKIS